MTTRLAAAAFLGACVLAGCAAAPPDPQPTAASSTASVTGTPPGGPGSPAPATATPGPTATPVPPRPPAALLLSGTAIGGLPLGDVPAAELDPMLVARFGRASRGEPLLCRTAGEAALLGVVDHAWASLRVQYARTGGAAVAIAWSVDLTDVPDGVALAGRLPWRPTFAQLERLDGVEVGTVAGVRTAWLARARLAWSGPARASRPDTLSGGPLLRCDR